MLIAHFIQRASHICLLPNQQNTTHIVYDGVSMCVDQNPFTFVVMTWCELLFPAAPMHRASTHWNNKVIINCLLYENYVCLCVYAHVCGCVFIMNIIYTTCMYIYIQRNAEGVGGNLDDFLYITRSIDISIYIYITYYCSKGCVCVCVCVRG